MRAYANLAANDNPAAVRFDDPIHHGQPQPGAGVLCREKRIENLLDHVLWNPAPVVREANAGQRRRGVRDRTDAKRSAAGYADGC